MEVVMKRKSLIGACAVVFLIAVTAGAWSFIRSARRTISTPTNPASATYLGQGKNAKARPRDRNLSLQPEALIMSRRLGSRFAADKREKSVLIGTLTIGADRRTVQISRTQKDDGEQIEIKLAGSGPPLTWDASQGVMSAGARANQSDRELIERLVFDSPDQFVLAQLRGASYYTVARNVRAEGAATGAPLWNIVRIDDSQTDELKRPQSPWRLYFINVSTGLVDRILSDVQGVRTTAEVSRWADQNGEKVPAQITWSAQGQTLMQYTLMNFSHANSR